jgi:hypothetical protein
VRLVLELQLLAAAQVQRQRQNQSPPPLPQQQQQQQQLPASHVRRSTYSLLLLSADLLDLQIRALAVTSRGWLPPEVLQQAGLQLLQALAAPLQQLQLGGPDDLYRASGAVPQWLSGTLYWLVTAACGAEPVQLSQEDMGE